MRAKLLCAAASAAVPLLLLGLLESPLRAAPGGPAASSKKGMGATPFAGGTTFRVWAPHADHVFVAGDWNGMSDTATELAKEANGSGNFSADVAGAAAGMAYEYVIRHGADTLHKADPRARKMRNSNGASEVVDPAAYRWKDAKFRPPAPSEAVIYELHVGAFNPTTPGRPGTFASAAAKLDDLRDLGVNAIEILPPAEFPGDFSWGYNPAEPFAPESAYGSPDDLRALVDAAHARGIAVLVDVVHNHWGPADLPMWRFDGETFASAGATNAGGIYFYTDARGQTPWGPRPDFGRPEVRDYVVDNARMWVEEFHADGLRWDSTSNIRAANGAPIPEGAKMLHDACEAAHARRPGSIMIAEDFQGDASITNDAAKGGLGFDSQWDGGFFHPVDDAIIAVNDQDRSMKSVRDGISNRLSNRATARVVYTESHDEVANGKKRIPEMISPGDPASLAARKRSTLGAAVALTSPGIPMLFMGQEFLEDGWFADNRPLDWSKETKFAGIRAMYRDLVALRRSTAGATRGLLGEGCHVFHVNDKAKVIAWHRFDRGGPGDDVVVVASFTAKPFPVYEIGFPRTGIWHTRFNSDAKRYQPDFGDAKDGDVNVIGMGGRDGLPGKGAVALGAYSVVILSQ
jgi:1,4-alpha-glucan branching enzyme